MTPTHFGATTPFLRALTRVLRVALLAFCAFVASRGVAQGQAETPPQNDDAAQAFPGYRFWMAPASEIDRWPWGDEKYYPISLKLFNEWVVSDEDARRRRERFDRAESFEALRKLSLTARLRDDALEGEARVEPRDRSSLAPDAEENALFHVKPFSMAFDYLPTDDAPEDRLALYSDGAFYFPRVDGRPRSFHWSQRGVRDASGALVFDLKFPAALATELDVATDASTELRASSGSLSRVVQSSEDSDEGLIHWRLFCGGRSSTRLTATFADRAAPTEARRKPGVRQEFSYRASLEGLELVAKFEFDRVDAPIGETILEFDESLAPIAAEWGKTQYDRANVLKTTSDGAFVLKLPPPKLADGESLGELKVVAYAPIDEGSRALPSVALRSNVFEWRERVARVVVEKPFAVVEAETTNAARTRDAARARQDDQSVLAFKYFEPDGVVRLKIARDEPIPMFDSATDCALAGADATAKTTLLFNFDAAKLMNVEIPLAKGWNVDSVQTPLDEPVMWTKARGVDGRYFLRLAFKNRPTPNQPLRVVVAARRAVAIDAKIPVDSLCPIDLSENLQGAHALALRADSSSQIKLTTKDGKPRAQSKTQPNFIFGEAQIRDALASAPSGARLYFGDQTVGLYASLENVKSNYSAELSCACELQDDSLKETWKLRCAPTSGKRVERILFFVRRATEDADEDVTVETNLPWTWSTANEPERVYRAEKISSKETDAYGAVARVDAYEMKLPTSRSVPFDLNLFYTAPCPRSARDANVPLVFFPDAGNSTAEIVIDSVAARPFKTKREALFESTVPSTNGERYETLKKAFRYDPTAVFDFGDRDEDRQDVARAVRVFPRLELELYPRSFALDETPDSEVVPVNALCWFESLDSYYQSDGAVSHCATFYVENRGLDSLEFILRFPTRDLDACAKSVRAVWVDDQRAEWTLDWLDDAESSSFPRALISARLPSERRCACVEIEIVDGQKTSLKGRWIKPCEIECQAPTLSGVWNAWLPPQTASVGSRGESAFSSRGRVARAILDFFSRDDAVATGAREAASRMASRLGDEFALRSAISDARQLDADSDASGAVRLDAPTWGDVFGSPALVESLFARAATEMDEEANAARESAFGKLSTTEPPTRLLLDSYALARAGISPDAELPRVSARSNEERAEKMLADSNLSLLFLAPDFVVVTTLDAASREFDLETVELLGAAARRVKNARDGRRLRDSILSTNSKRFAYPKTWRDAKGAVSPWRARAQDEIARGWTRVSIPLGRASSGTYVVDRSRLAALELISLMLSLAFFCAVWNPSPRFLVGAISALAAALLASRYETAAIARGCLWCALGVFGWKVLRAVAPSKEERAREVADGAAVAIGPNGKKASTLDVVFDDDSESSEGFVDFEKMPSREAILLRAKETENPRGATSLSTLVALACLLFTTLVSLAFGVGAAQEEPSAEAPSASRRDGESKVGADASSPASAVGALDGLFPLSNDFVRANDAPPRASSNAEDESTWREPKRVFVPVDENGEPTGNACWVDAEFYEKIRADLRARPREKNWRVVDALYEGAINYNSFSQTTSLFSLKATYRLAFDSEFAVVALPAVALATDGGAKFDKQTISPSYDESGKEMTFEIYASPGVHTLELSIVPPLFFENDAQAALPVLPTPSARLELDAPSDAPSLDVPNAFGKTTRTARKFIAELGAVDKLIVVKDESASKGAKTTVDVEQYFLVRPRPTQTDARAVFRYQIIGGKLQSLDVECDPSFAFSGYCKCDAAEIESVEAPDQRASSMRVVFKKPVSGSLALNVDFVANNFSGVGRLPLPEIRTKGAKIVKNLLAVAPGAGVECEAGEDDPGLRADFLNGWGAVDSKIAYVCDLSRSRDSQTIGVKLENRLPQLNEKTSVMFRPSQVEMRSEIAINADSELFQLVATIPEPFVLDSAVLCDQDGAELDAPTFYASQRELTLTFDPPLLGKYALTLVGRGKARVDAQTAIPEAAFKGVDYLERRVNLYCAPNLCLRWENLPQRWTELVAEPVAKTEFGDDARAFGQFLIGAVAESVDEENADAAATETAAANSEGATPSDDAPLIFAQLNEPVVAGLERVFLYPTTDAVKKTTVWKAAYELKFKVEKGRLDSLVVETDDLYAFDPLPSNSNFTAETSTASGANVVVFSPKRALLDDGKENALFFTSTFKNDATNVRLPKFTLVPTALSEDYSKVARRVLLATLKEEDEIKWSIRNMKLFGETNFRDAAEKNKQALKLSRGVQNLTLNGVASIAEEENAETSRAFIEKLPPVVEQISRVDSVYFTSYLRGEDASASLSSKGERLNATFAQHSFYVNDRREIFGVAVFLIQPDANEFCELVAPESVEILEAKVNGARRLVERIRDEEDESDSRASSSDAKLARWRIDLDGSPYVKRLVAFFRSRTARARRSRARLAQRRAETFDVDFLRLANADVDRVVWLCAFEDFETSRVDARWRVGARAERALDFAEKDCVPLGLSDADVALYRLRRYEASALLNAREADAARLVGAQIDDRARFAARWHDALTVVESELLQFAGAEREGVDLDSAALKALAVYENGALLSNELGNANFPERGWNDSARLDPNALMEKIADAKSKEVARGDLKNRVARRTATPERLWALEVGSSARLLMGAADCELESIRVAAAPKPFDFFASPFSIAVMILTFAAACLHALSSESRGKRRKTTFGAVCVLLWGGACLLAGWKLVALVGAFAIAFVPSGIASATRRLRARRAAALELAASRAETVSYRATPSSNADSISTRDIVESVSQIASSKRRVEDADEDDVRD